MKPAHNKKGQSKGSTRIIGGSSHGRAADNSAEFHAQFSAQFLQRYADLFQALAAPVQHVALLNSFTTVNDIDEMGLTERVCQEGPISCYRWDSDGTRSIKKGMNEEKMAGDGEFVCRGPFCASLAG
jgi:hypothetical protein